jgi:hypothetical protein
MKKKKKFKIKTKNPDSQKQIEDFLSLGGSGCWEGNLDEMREGRR